MKRDQRIVYTFQAKRGKINYKKKKKKSRFNYGSCIKRIKRSVHFYPVIRDMGREMEWRCKGSIYMNTSTRFRYRYDIHPEII